MSGIYNCTIMDPAYSTVRVSRVKHSVRFSVIVNVQTSLLRSVRNESLLKYNFAVTYVTFVSHNLSTLQLSSYRVLHVPSFVLKRSFLSK